MESSNSTVMSQPIHESIKHSCEYCKYEATTKGNLYNHVQSTHIGVEYSLSIVNMKQLQQVTFANM